MLERSSYWPGYVECMPIGVSRTVKMRLTVPSSNSGREPIGFVDEDLHNTASSR
jgi:hypothetical protein